MIIRKYTYKLYPTKSEIQAMFDTKRVHCDLYNAALQERIDAWQKQKLSISYTYQAKSLTEIRSFDKQVQSVNAASEQVTLKRLDKSFKAFFRRVKRGEKAGFPRFKSFKRFTGWGYKQHGDGFRFYKGKNGKHGRLYLQNIGTIKARGQMRIQGDIKCCEILHRRGEWYLSLTIESSDSKRFCKGDEMLGFDWGVTTLLSGKTSCGDTIEIDNPRWYRESRLKREALQQTLSRKKKGSNRWRRAAKKLSKFTAKEARKRHDHHHKLSADIAKLYPAVCGEELEIKTMTKTTKGTAENPGCNVKQKAASNREILDTAPGALYQLINYKVEETGGWFVKSPTKKLKPSQRCPKCWRTAKKDITERVHKCAHQDCLHEDGRDLAAAEVNLVWLKQELLAGNRPDRH